MRNERGPRPWDAEHEVDRALAEALVGEQFPDLRGETLELVGRGWDVVVWRAGAIAFRFPRRALGRACIETEMQVLPKLENLFDVEIPRPRRFGAPTPRFDAPFYGHPLLSGTTADRAAPSDDARVALAPRIGRFLRDLHAIDEARARAMGVAPDAFRAKPRESAARAVPRLASLAASSWSPLVAPAGRALAGAPDASLAPPCLLHGDLYARHCVLDERGDLVGVLDWGDVCTGDRALDLAIAYSFLPRRGRAALFDAYGQVDAATRDRARLFAIARHGVQLLAYALDVGDAPLTLEAARALDNALDPDAA